MISWQGISEAIAGAMVIIWGLYTEFRLRQAQSDNAQMLRALNDAKIEAAVNDLDDDSLRAELTKDVSGHTS